MVIALAFWLPGVIRQLAKGLAPSRSRRGPYVSTSEKDHKLLVDQVVYTVGPISARNSLQEGLGRYIALRSAVEAGLPEPGASFELFGIAGHLNAHTASPALARRNLANLERHGSRAVNDLIDFAFKVESDSESTPALRNSLISFFEAFGDVEAVEALKAAETKIPSFQIPDDRYVSETTCSAA